MYANTENPPKAAIETPAPRLVPAAHQCSVGRLSKLLSLIERAHERVLYSRQQYDTHSFLSSPFVSRERWMEDARKWTYITFRLERYYLKKVCELNSMAYRAISQTL